MWRRRIRRDDFANIKCSATININVSIAAGVRES
jgi:hypothetical protein